MEIPPDLKVLEGRSLLEGNSTSSSGFDVQVERGDSYADDEVATPLNFTWSVSNYEK